MRRLVAGLSDRGNRSSFVTGFKEAIPVFSGTIPFAIIVGITAVELGFSAVEITVLSTIAFAGASQLAAIDLMVDGSPFLVVVVTVILVNIRFSMYSATLAPKFESLSRLRKAVYSFLIVDTVYALSTSRFRNHDEGGSHWYYFGSGIAFWLSWVLGTAIGAWVGVGVPGAFPVELVLPLVFIALLFPVLEDRPSVATAVVAGGVAAATAPLPYNLGLLLGVGCGLATGVFLNR
jgi:4-azaleucine resistance transporter AzlC